MLLYVIPFFKDMLNDNGNNLSYSAFAVTNDDNLIRNVFKHLGAHVVCINRLLTYILTVAR